MSTHHKVRAEFPDVRSPLERMVDEMIRLRRAELMLMALQCTVVMLALIAACIAMHEGWMG